MADATAADLEPGKSIEPTVINLRTQLVKTGRSRELLADGEHMTLRIHCYAPGIGEHGLHAHLDEEHIFIVLDGCARFSGIDGPLPLMTKNQGIALPKGCFYEFANAGDTPTRRFPSRPSSTAPSSNRGVVRLGIAAASSRIPSCRRTAGP